MPSEPHRLPLGREFKATYGERIARVSAHIHAHLDAPLDLDRLASIACFSPWHFHRIYTAVAGETIAETYRRHRLHRAAAALASGTRPVAEIARAAGFGSAAAFIRAFSQAYGDTPGAFRKRRRPPFPTLVSKPEMPLMSDVEIVDVAARPLIALAHRGDYMTIGQSFETLGAHAGPRGLIGPDSHMIGLYYDDPAVVAASACRSHACLPVPNGTAIEAPFEAVSLPAGRYARAVHKGPYADLPAFYNRVFSEWLPASGHEPADGPVFEEYLNSPAMLAPTEWLTAVNIPLKS